MVGIVIVSHSHRIAEGVAELAREMGGPDVRLETAGGLDMPDHPTGTDAMLVMGAIERAWSDDGVLVLMDLGSAVLSAEMALDMLPRGTARPRASVRGPHRGRGGRRGRRCEGGRGAGVGGRRGPRRARREDRAPGDTGAGVRISGEAAATDGVGSADAASADPGSARSVRLTIRNPHGLHARPAARLVQTAAGFDATVHVRNVTTGRGPADAASLNGVATLGAATGHEVEVTASGPQAAEAVDAIQALAERDFDEGPEATPRSPAAARSGDGEPARRRAARVRGIPGVRDRAGAPVPRGRARRPDERAGGEATDTGAEAAALDRAIAAVRVDIERQRETVSARAGAQEAGIFDAHLLFLRDAALLEPSRRAIDEGRAAAHAWHDAVERTAAAWDGLEDDYLRARAADLRSVGAQVLARLLGVEPPRPRLETPGILLADDLTPADAAALDPVARARDRHGARRPHVARRRARAIARHPRRRGRGPGPARGRGGDAARARRGDRRVARASGVRAPGAARRRPARARGDDACRATRRRAAPPPRATAWRSRSPRTSARPARSPARSRRAPTASACSGRSSCSWSARTHAGRGRAGGCVPERRGGAGRPVAAAAHARRRRGQAAPVPSGCRPSRTPSSASAGSGWGSSGPTCWRRSCGRCSAWRPTTRCA